MSQRARAGLFALTILVLVAGTAPADAQISSVRVAFGLSRPVFATAPIGDQNRLFVLEKLGRIRIIKDGVLLTRPFLDIQGAVNSSFNEQGLLGLAFDPDYDTNGFFYVYHNVGSGAGSTAIRRYTVSSDPDSVDTATRLKIVRFLQPFTNHNGGTIAFGPGPTPGDDALYIGLGDGGGANDTADRAQDTQQYMGKLLRIDPRSDDFPADDSRYYAIPSDNPYASGVDGVLDEIWSIGWRNPYRFSFDRQTRDLYTADVGQNCWEEIDFQPASSTGRENWGWNLMEGTHCFDKTSPFNCFPTTCNPALYEGPIHDYRHQSGRCSITGGFVYRGQDIPSLDGTYFFADYCSKEIWTFKYDGANLTDFTDRTNELDPTDGSNIGPITGFGQDGRGELYICDDSGQVFKILPDSVNGVDPNPVRGGYFGMTGGVPNPFVTATHFQVRLETPSPLVVAVYDAAGRRVRTLHDQPSVEGVIPVSWDGRGADSHPVPAGVYFVRAVSGNRTETKRVTVLR